MSFSCIELERLFENPLSSTNRTYYEECVQCSMSKCPIMQYPYLGVRFAQHSITRASCKTFDPKLFKACFAY